MANEAGPYEMVLTRELRAPIDLVWRVSSDPEHAQHWRCPRGFTITSHSHDFRPGGAWVFTMHAPNGGPDFPNRIDYIEIEAPNRLSFLHGEGPDLDLGAMRVLVTLEATPEGTRYTQRVALPSREAYEGAMAMGAVELGETSVDKLAELVHRERDGRGLTLSFPSGATARITRALPFPKASVWEALTKPEHIRNWLGPRRMTMTEARFDVAVGGSYRYALATGDATYGFRGEYLEIVPGEKLVQTFEFEGFPGAISTETLTLAEFEGVTYVTVRIDYGTPEARAGVMGSGMEGGANESYDRLEELLAAA